MIQGGQTFSSESIVTNGKGLMQGYRFPVSTADRWAIVAHVRRMQDEEPLGDVASAAP